jgi:hypothetical protein
MDWLIHEEEILRQYALELSNNKPPDGYDRYWNFRFESYHCTPYERFLQEPMEVYSKDVLSRQDFWNMMVYEFFKRVEKRSGISFAGGLMRAVNWATHYILRGRYYLSWRYPVPPRAFHRRDIEDAWRKTIWILVEGQTANIYAGLCVKISQQFGNDVLEEWDTFPPNLWDTLCYELLERFDSKKRINYYRQGHHRRDYQDSIQELYEEMDVQEGQEDEKYEPDDEVERGHIE